jgi:hypothetical protein
MKKSKRISGPLHNKVLEKVAESPKPFGPSGLSSYNSGSMKNENLVLLRVVGEALYGERWQMPIAADLGVSDRAVRYWLSADNPCPDDMGARLLAILARKREALVDLEAVVLDRLRSSGEAL